MCIEPGCTRLDDSTALTIPLSWFSTTDSLYQLLVDARQRELLPKWKNGIYNKKWVLKCHVMA